MEINYNQIVYKNGVMILPPGFRFHPTDEELLLQYLRRKVLNYPLPADVIGEAEVCKLDPWNLPGKFDEERYFFSTNEVKYPNGNRSNRATASGYWKATGLDKQIVSLRFRQIVGTKKTLVFYTGKAPNGGRTNWIMHEYRLNIPGSIQKLQVKNNWVICRIFLKKRNINNTNKAAEEEEDEDVDMDEDEDEEEEEEEDEDEDEAEEEEAADGQVENAPVFYDFLARERAALNRFPANSASGSSGVTTKFEESEEEEDYEDSSSCNSFTFSFKPKPKPKPTV